MIFRIGFIRVQLPGKDVTVPTTRYEARIIVEPMDAPDWALMSLINEVNIVFACIELIDVDMILRCTGKKMATMRESDFPATLDANGLERLQAVLEHVHHSDSVSEANDDVETSRVEGHTVRLIIKDLAYLQLKWTHLSIVPNPDCFID